MNTRQALKILSRYFPDPQRKPSATTPYTDGQWCAAARRLRMSFRRAQLRAPSTPLAALVMKWRAGAVSQARARKRSAARRP